ncbi:hypothetical protein GLOIN_2v1778046 [Rhizophagus clarus]|uniref:Uncharacterized protein n=1 Tax=Rhizophagus clarus TaxID=94130 RepID=A0A8H3R4N7_9GLOM|nr:hypothetical protein GLOIN_2v1778046 [Rhizophagus clarus]
MATITELVNAIDGYVDNRATTRNILIDQIKKATRQICQKENNLQRDIFQEQQRRYNAEAECDNEIIQKKANLYWYITIGKAQILALQNNLPNQINLAGIHYLYFNWDDSIPDFLAQFKLDLQNREIDSTGAGANGRAQAIGQANLVAVNERTAVQIGADRLNEDEDWYMTEGHPTNLLVNTPNTGNASQQQGISLEDIQKVIQNVLVQQKTEYQTLLEKQKPDFQSQIVQQSIAQKAQALASQIVNLQSNIFAKIDRVEEGINKTCKSVNQLTKEFQKLNICKPVVQSNFNQFYFTSIKPINPQYASSDLNDDEDNN